MIPEECAPSHVLRQVEPKTGVVMSSSSPTESAQASEDSRRQEVLAAQVRLLYSNASVGFWVTLIATSILARLQWEVLAHSVVFSWWLSMFLLAAGRFTLALRYRRSVPCSS